MMVAKAGTLVMEPKSVTFRRHDQLVSVLFGYLFLQHYIFNVFISSTEVFDGIKIMYLRSS